MQSAKSPVKQGAKTSTANDARARRTRAAYHSAMHALLGRKAFDQLTVREVAAEAGTGYATFFRHYAGLEDLLDDVVSEELDALLDRTMPVFIADNTRASCETLCSYVDANRALWCSILTGGAAARVREEFIRKAHALVAQHERPGGRIPSSLAVIFATSAVLDILSWWLREGSERPVAEIAGYIDELAVAPVLK